MGYFNEYADRIGRTGGRIGDGRRERELQKMQDRMWRRASSNPAMKELYALEDECTKRYGIIVNTVHMNEKKLYAMPGESFRHGGILVWKGFHWLVTAVDADSDFTFMYTILQCNYLLKWLNEHGEIIERWCAIEDGTKYIAGEYQDRTMAYGDARIAVTIGKDEETEKLVRGKRFLIDDHDVEQKVMAYKLTKTNKLFNNYSQNADSGEGAFRFVLTESNLEDNDNVELRIADYYSWKPKRERPKPDPKEKEGLDEIVEDAIEEEENRNDTSRGWL